MAKADKIGLERKKVEYYSDFLSTFDKNPVTGYLAVVSNEDAIKQSIRNIIFTNKNERFYNPGFGSDILRSMFDPMDPVSLMTLRQNVIDSINNFEPRAIVEDVLVSPAYDENSVNIRIVFSIANFNDTFSMNVIVKRIR